MKELTVTKFNDIRVLTTQQIADAYETESQVITNNFNRNKDRYVSGKHFIYLTGNELRNFRAKNQNDVLPNANRLYLWTKKGAFLHAKSLNTDTAWEVYDKLVDTYFMKKEDLLEGISPELRAVLVVDKRVTAVEQKVGHLENTMNIDYAQQQTLKNEVNKVVVKALGGKESNAYKEVSKKVFSEINHEIQERFAVNSRNNIPKKRFEEAIVFIRSWGPNQEIKWMIDGCNAQTSL